MRPTLLLIACLVLLTGCNTVQTLTGGDPELSRGYALLHDLMKKQANVSKLLVIKDASEPTTKLIEQIAKTSKDTRDQLEKYAEQNDSLSLEAAGLPTIETETRDSIQAAKTKYFLGNSDIELELILSQIKATEYGHYLSQTLAEADPDEPRSKYLKSFAEQYKKYNDQLLKRLAIQ